MQRSVFVWIANGIKVLHAFLEVGFARFSCYPALNPKYREQLELFLWSA
jgi:hypothetical protein